MTDERNLDGILFFSVVNGMTAEPDHETLLNGDDWRVNYLPDEKRLARSRNVRGAIDTMRLFSGEQLGVHRPDYEDAGWIPAAVPGNVREILLRQGLISDPYVGRNNEQSRWVEDFAWWYRKTFHAPESWRGKRLELRFDGIDYKADFYLNGRRLGTHEGMFTPAVFDVTEHIVVGGPNVVCAGFAPPPRDTADHYWDGRIPERARAHRCQMSWGWDWSRHLLPIGIWDSVRLTAHGDVRLTDVFARSRRKPRNRWDVAFEMEIENAGAALNAVEAVIELRGANFRTARQRTAFKTPLRRGTRTLKKTVSLDAPELWWPNGYGRQRLYEATITLSHGERTLARKRIRFGVREVRMAFNPDAPPDAYPLIFTVNGRKIFAKGGNWVPPDMIPSRLDAARYGRLVALARDAHWNMFRMWGGGLFEKEAFYDLCDEHGLLVWQEFAHACSNYPKNRKYVQEKGREATHLIRRLRNHPCIALWCGGNETQYYGERPDSPVLTQYGERVRKLHPGMDYHTTCPDLSREGERHHGPWTYRDHAFWNAHFRLFASEVGCNGMPDAASVERFIPKGERFPFGPSCGYHFMWVDKEGRAEAPVTCPDPSSLAQYVDASQLAQADTLQYIMEHYRRNAWKSSGCLIWQYNESWPTGAYSIVDYYGAPKTAYYWLRNACEPIHVSAKDDGWRIEGNRFSAEVWVSNDSDRSLPDARVHARLTDARGKALLSKQLTAPVPAEASAAMGRVTCDVPVGRMENPLILTLELRCRGRRLSRRRTLYTTTDFANAFLKSATRLTLPRAAVAGKGATTVVEAEVRNNGPLAAVGVALRLPGVAPERVRHEDSRFHLLPGESRRVKLWAGRDALAHTRQQRGGPKIEAEAWNSPPIRARI